MNSIAPQSYGFYIFSAHICGIIVIDGAFA